MKSEDSGLIFPKPKRKKKKRKHKESIENTKRGECFLCAMYGDKSYKETEEHHVVYGSGGRPKSEAEGLKVYLCAPHHRTAPDAVHNCRKTRELLCRIFQEKYEETHTREEWMKLAGKNYL